MYFCGDTGAATSIDPGTPRRLQTPPLLTPLRHRDGIFCYHRVICSRLCRYLSPCLADVYVFATAHGTPPPPSPPLPPVKYSRLMIPTPGPFFTLSNLFFVCSFQSKFWDAQRQTVSISPRQGTSAPHDAAATLVVRESLTPVGVGFDGARWECWHHQPPLFFVHVHAYVFMKKVCLCLLSLSFLPCFPGGRAVDLNTSCMYVEWRRPSELFRRRALLCRGSD